MEEDFRVNQLYFTSHRRKSTRTVRLEYGKLGKMFVLKIYEGATNCKTTREDLPKEILFEEEQQLLKDVYERKKVLLDGRWIVTEKQSVSQPAFIRNDLIDGEITNDTWWES